MTSDDATSGNMPQGADEANYVIAEEVSNITFSYYDGSSWQDSWDGTATGSDNKTAQGPPRLIAVTVEIATGNGDVTKSYRHVVAIPTANGTAQTSTTSP